MDNHSRRIGFIGGGRVTRILAGRWERVGLRPAALLVHEPGDEAFEKLMALTPRAMRATLEEAAAADVVFLALHPPAIGPALPAVRGGLGPAATVVSLAPKVSLAGLTTGLGTTRLARMIPNAPSIVGRGYNPVAFGEGVDAATRASLATLFAPWGPAPEVDEAALEAYAILTGMGPTYFWFQWQALRELAGELGLPAGQADEALRHMLEGAVSTLFDGGLAPGQVMDLIPVRPLESVEADLTAAYRDKLLALFAKIRPGG
jgi:pyrroline-5-carboxylate reductase